MNRFDKFDSIKDIAKKLNIKIPIRRGYAYITTLDNGQKCYVNCVNLQSDKYDNKFFGEKDSYYSEKGTFNDYRFDKSNDVFLLFAKERDKYCYYGMYKLDIRNKYNNKYEERVYKLISV